MKLQEQIRKNFSIGLLSAMCFLILPLIADAQGKIAFQSARDFTLEENNWEIYIMNPDGTNQTRLTNDPDTLSNTDPSISRDGTKIAFSCQYPDGSHVCVMNADGTNVTILTNNPGADAGQPAFSSDGSKIVYLYASVAAESGIYIMNADGTNQTQLTFNASAAHYINPSFSPDGAKIVFASVFAIAPPGICVINTDGTNFTQLTNNADFEPEFSPDGTRIAFASSRDGNFQIYAMNADGTNVTRLTNGTPAAGRHPSYSPDGSKIALNSNVGIPQIYVMNADGSNPTQITNSPVNVAPSWSGLPVTFSYNFTGFFQPIDNLPMVNAASAGSSIPVKFSLNGYQGLNIFAPGYPSSQQIACSGGAPVDAIEETTTAGSSSLNYDATTDRYIYVWKTERAWRGTCRQMIVKLKDASLHVASFQFR